jgi:DNA-binding XRE family transcriptional regulator
MKECKEMKTTEKLSPEASARMGEVRKAMGMTREDMANLLSFSYQVYTAIERGDKPLYVDRLEPLRKTRGNVDYIISGRGEKLNETKSDFFESQYSMLTEKQKKIVMTLIKQLLE